MRQPMPLTKDDIENHQVSEHERHREVEEAQKEGLIRRGDLGQDEGLGDSVEERERAEECGDFLEDVYGADAEICSVR